MDSNTGPLSEDAAAVQQPLPLPTPNAGNPFAAASEEFFPGGQRKRLFDQLRHLSQWSRRALLVTGPVGAGKTVLYAHLARVLGKDASAAALAGAQTPDQQAMFVTLAAALGIDHPLDASTELLNDLIRAYVQTQNEAERLCVILVDDAHLLDLGTLEALLSLSAECRVRLIFFGETALSKLVDSATVNVDIACHETPLLALSVTDCRAYIEWRTKQLGYTQMPFTEEQLAQIYSETDGIPGRIDELASEMLRNMADGKPVSSESSVRLFPMPHLWIALSLAAVLGVLYLLFDSPAPSEQELTESLPALPPVNESGQIEPGVPGLEMVRPDTDLARADVNQDATPEPATRVPLPKPVADPEVTAAMDSTDAEPATQPVTPVTDQSIPDAGTAQTTETATPPGEVSEPVETAIAATTVGTPRSFEDSDEVSIEEPSEVPPKESPKQWQSKPATGEPVKQTVSAPPESVSPLLAAVPGINGPQWLLQRDSSHYTLQLITLGSQDGMIKYLKEQSRPSDFAVYERLTDGKRLLVATYGSYSSRAAAERASRQLPASVGKLTPWIRPFQDVQNTVRSSRNSSR